MSDIDKILNKALKQKEELEKLRQGLDEQKLDSKKEVKQLEKQKEPEIEKSPEQPLEEKEETFLTEAKNRSEKLMDKYDDIHTKLANRIEEGYEKIDYNKGKEILTKYRKDKNEIEEKTETKVEKLQEEFPESLKPVAYFEKKIQIDANDFKKYTQILEKEEEDINKEIKKKPNYEQYKDQYETERSQWKENHQQDVRYCRQEKQEVQKYLVSNIQKASEMAEDLVHETGPDYTGGDD